MDRRQGARALRVVCSDGKTAHVTTYGEGPPLIVLHGWGLDGLAYRAALRGFARRGYQVFAPTTNVALGRRWSLRGLARRVDAVCEALDIGPCPVIGHSFGGVVGARLALDFPGRVTSFIAVNSALISPGGWQLTRLALPGGHYGLAADRRVVAAFARAQRAKGSFAHLAGSVRWMLSTDMSSELPTLRDRDLPCAVLWATDAFLDESLGLKAAELMGGAFHIVGPRDAPHGALDHVWPLRSAPMFVERVVRVVEELRTRAPEASSRRSSIL